MSTVTPTYYLVHETPAGTRYAYPLAGVKLVERTYQRGPWNAETLTVTAPSGVQADTVGDWLISDAPIAELRRERPGAQVKDGLEKRDEPSVDGPVSPDLMAAFQAAPDRPTDADVEHFAEHDAAHACWQCRVYSVTYRTRYVVGEPIVDVQHFEDWAPLAGDPDPDPSRSWTVGDPSLLAVYGAHTAHLWPGALSGLRESVIERLKAMPLVSVQVWNHQSKVDVEVKVPWETPRTKTEMHKPYGKRKSVPRTVSMYALTQRVSVEIPDRLTSRSKTEAIAGFDAVVTREVAKIVPFGENPRGCDHCDGLGWVNGDA